jgi:cytochrome P450
LLLLLLPAGNATVASIINLGVISLLRHPGLLAAVAMPLCLAQ